LNKHDNERDNYAQQKARSPRAKGDPLHAVLGGSELRQCYWLAMYKTCTVNIPNFIFEHLIPLSRAKPPNGLRYLRWGGDGEAVQPEK